MEAKKNKLCKMRLRRLRPDMIDKLKSKRGMTKADIQFSSSSSDSEDDEMKIDDECEKISVQLRSPLALGFDPYMVLTKAQAALKLCSDEKYINDAKLMEESCERAQPTKIADTAIASVAKSQKKPKYCKKQKLNYYSPLEKYSSGIGSKLKSSLENDVYDLINFYHGDDEGVYNFNCNHARTSSSTADFSVALTDRSNNTGNSSAPLSENCSMRFSKLFENNCISVMDDENPPTALSKILSIKKFDPLAPQQILAIIIKNIISLAELSQRDDNIVSIDIDKRRILEFSALSPEEKRNFPLNPYMDVSNIVVTHADDEFLTFCLCENCEKYREFVIHVMIEQFKATHMVVMLLDVLIKSYGPMLKNITAYNKFEKLLDSNRDIYWITCGVIYHKKAEHLDFIYDEYLSDNMILVLFSSILMLNNPLLLLQILSFHVECIVKAYAEGFLEIVEPGKSKIPADKMVNYILNGYDDLMIISEQVASYLFAFENDFLRKFSLTWKLLCQRLYQQHVHLHLADTMLACIITLKEEELTSHHTDLIKRYIQFDNIMNYVEKRWTDVWIELNKFNLSEVERKRRKSLFDVYRIFDTVVQDAIGFSLHDNVEDNDFYDFRFLKNRRLAWKNIMSYTKMKWPDGFFQPPNTLVIDNKCETCNVSLEYHAEYCKCITCSIAGGSLPPRRDADGKCSKCLAHERIEKDVNFYDSKIMNVCANDDFKNLVTKSTNEAKCENIALQDVGQELCSTLASVEEILKANDYDINKNIYHISWAVFKHLNSRKQYPHTTIKEEHFCSNCKLSSCLLARKILNNKISPSLSQDLVHYYQPMSMSREELRSILPNIMLYNRKLVASNNGLDLIDVHDLVVKIYWVFIISIYATYFIDYDEESDSNSYLDALEFSNNDIKVNLENIKGNKDDTKFLEFLDKVKSLSPFNNDVESNIPSQCDDIPPPIIIPENEEQAQMSESVLSNTVEAQPRKTCKEKSKKCCFDHYDVGDYSKESHLTKKRSKKDCNHGRMNETRDRLRKKLSQIANARRNAKPLQIPQSTQTPPTITTSNNLEPQNQMELILNPEDLKRLQQLQQLPSSWDDVHEIVAAFEQLHTEVNRNENLQNLCECLQQMHMNPKSETKTINSNSSKKGQHNIQKREQQHQQQLLNDNQSPLPKSFSSQESPNKKTNLSNNSGADVTNSNQDPKGKDSKSTSVTKSVNDLDFVNEICEIIDSYSKDQAKRSSNESLHNLCEYSENLQTNPKNESKSNNKNNKIVKHKQKPQQEQQIGINQQPTHQSNTLLEPPNKISNLSSNSTRDASNSSQGTKSRDNNSTNTTTPISPSKAANNLDFVSEICEIIDNYSKEQAKRRWIKETLSFIEGPTNGIGKKKTQPQTTNPKKAAKKAKQKQRKEEEKRIAELHDLRAQFHNIYFKEFSEKRNLKSLKTNKKRDKKKIVELENNIKNLQRAKAKVETVILELIATVKQTNSEFKFSYLPTKEQQMEKIRELEGHEISKDTDKTIKVRNLLHHATKDSTNLTIPSSSPFTITPTNNLNMMPESYSMPYAHANHFPYNLGFPPPASPAFGLMRAAPMYYAPPPTTAVAPDQQERPLAPDVVGVMTANASNNNITDPSKRIVTIRRVNLPNVPEPQVTVTAKGSSPDKDKLLYTFINGQLVQTNTAPPINISQIPTLTSLKQRNQSQTLMPEAVSYTHASKLAVENALTIPPPPPIPPLSKTQRKKERKRMAKLQIEAAAESERKFEQEGDLRELKERKQLELYQKQNKSKKKDTSSKTTEQHAMLSYYPTNKELSDKTNKNKMWNSNSTTLVSTNENNKSPQLPQMLVIKKLAKQKRSDSTTTSCSAATLTSSNNSTSSQMNTRDNSVSSLKPVDLIQPNVKKNGVKEQKSNVVQKLNTGNKNKTQTNQLKQQRQNKKQTRISSAPSTTSSEAEDQKEQELDESKESNLSVSVAKTKNIQEAPKVKSLVNKEKDLKSKIKTAQKSITVLSSDGESEGEIVERGESILKEHKKRRTKLVDNGQFDNNPFKSLHMQDSETDWSSVEEEENDITECKSKLVLKQKIISQKSNHKGKHEEQSNATTSQRKKHDTDIKENKTQKPSTSFSAKSSKIMTNKTAKSNKTSKVQQLSESCDKQSYIKLANTTKVQQKLHDVDSKSNNQTRLQKRNTEQNSSNVQNSSKSKVDNRQMNSNILNSQTKPNKQQNNTLNVRSQHPTSSAATNTSSLNSTNCKTQTKNNRIISNRNTNCSKNDMEQNHHNFHHNNQQLSSCDNIENKNQTTKRSQRNKKYQQKAQKHLSNMPHQNCSSGIPNHMGYFNVNEVNITPPHTQQPTNNNGNNIIQNSSYQFLHLSGNQVQSTTTSTTAQQHQQHINSNVSIMDQLNRGVQVENLSLPPGITLTKVDPIKSEQLRQKSESIKKLAKPLQPHHQQPNNLPQNAHAFHPSSSGTTIIAPPVVNPMSSYYSPSYVTATTGIDSDNGIIMVEANPPKISNINNKKMPQATATKQSKNKKRRNKSKANNVASCRIENSGNSGNSNYENNVSNGQPKMITLRNPLFHIGATAATATILQSPVILPGRPVDGFPLPTPLPVDQPAAIIKNENGMYTIRNPALHQAVTNGLAMGGYRQFGNINYYTPQEVVGEAARATRQQQQQNENKKPPTINDSNPLSFSYFSNDVVQPNTPHNNISISCTSVTNANTNLNANNNINGNSVGGLIGDAAVIQRPTPQQRPISAIGSEIKSAQQQKQKTKVEQQQWSNFSSETLPVNKNDKLNTFLDTTTENANAAVVGTVSAPDSSLQEKYQQSKYYNGFDVFTSNSGGSSSSVATCTHIHHNCGDDSPPPSVTGYNSYLEGIPNTGVIRYDDASFLKNLIPGQNLNNEVTIHNVNESNFISNAQSPPARQVEITPVYGKRSPSASLYESTAGQTNHANYKDNYRDPLNDYNNDATIFPNNNMHLNLNELETSMKYDFEPSPSTSGTAVADDNSHNTILDFKDLLIKNGPNDPASNSTSPYMDENALEGFVQNMSSLKISNTSKEKQSPHLNNTTHCTGHGTTTTTSANPSNGWW